MRAELLDTVHVGNVLGEGVLWDDHLGAVWWVDIESCRLYRYRLSDKKLDEFETPERLGSFGLTETAGVLVAAFENGFAFFEPETGAVDWIAKPFEGTPGLRFNDGRIDAAGRFWCGTMAEDNKDGTIAKGTLYCLDIDLSVSAHLTGIHISNAICWSPDNRRMYFADSPTQRIRSFDFDAGPGSISNERTFAFTDGDVYPDGAVTDADGYLWNAQWGGARVVRYAPDGYVDFQLDMPVSQVTCTAFGGPALDLLFVTSARDGLSGERLESEPQAGNMFIYSTDARGAPVARFKGSRS